MNRIEHPLNRWYKCTVLGRPNSAGHSYKHVGESFLISGNVLNAARNCSMRDNPCEGCPGQIKPPWFTVRQCWMYRAYSHLKVEECTNETN